MYPASQSFADKVAVIVGATGAVGRAIADRLIAMGATIYAVGSARRSVEELIRASNWPEDKVHAGFVDLGSDDDVERFGAEVNSVVDRVDVLVHAAGAITLSAVADASVSAFDHQYRVNVRAPYRMTQILLPKIVASRGQVVFVNSTAGIRASKQGAQYGATKHALRAVADSLRDEVNQSGVRVLSVFLGRTASRMQAGVYQHERRPYDPGKLLQPEDVAEVAVCALTLPRTAEVTDLWIRPFQKSY